MREASRQSATKLVPRRAADLAAELARQHAHRRERGGVGNAHHAIDHVGHEGRLDARPADALDARGAVADRPGVARGVSLEEGRMLDIGDAQARGEALVADVAADGGRGAAGAGAHHDPGRHRMAFAAHLLEDRFGDVVVAAPVGGALGIGELVDMRWPPRLAASASAARHRCAAVVDQVAVAALVLDRLRSSRRGRTPASRRGRAGRACARNRLPKSPSSPTRPRRSACPRRMRPLQMP